jgi:hypothetical protein
VDVSLAKRVLSQLVDRALRRAMFGDPGFAGILAIERRSARSTNESATQLRPIAAVVLTSTTIIVLFD